jgi:hypothetical protein
MIEFWEQPQEWELYDLVRDPDETNNLADDPKHQAKLREMQAWMKRIRAELGVADPAGPPPVAAPCR